MTDTLETLQTLVRALEDGDQRHAIRALTRDELISWRYRELGFTSQCLSAGLARAGITRGEPVGLLAPNSAEWMVACLAILDAGAVVTPLDTQMPATELTHAIQDSGIRHVFTAGEAARRLEELQLDAPPRAIHLDAAPDAPEGWRAWCADRPEPDRLPSITAADQAALFYTSGTTGPPKGVPLTHGNIAANAGGLLGVEVGRPDDRILVPLPFHHVYPFTIGIIVVLALGATTVLPHSVLGPQIVRAMREGDATVLLGVPRLYQALDAAIHNRVAERGKIPRLLFQGMLRGSRLARRYLGWRAGPLLFRGLHKRMAPSLRLVVAGGAALDADLAERLQALGWEVGTGYGLTETSPILTYNPPEKVRIGSAGLPLPGVDLRVATPDEQGLGEVQARGPNVFAGYWKLPDKTARAFTEDGYYRTGDLGRFDADGYLYLEGRASEMIVLPGGENIDPERVEHALVAVDGIRDAGVLEHEGRLAAVLHPEQSVIRGLDAEQVEARMQQALGEANGALPSHHQVGHYRVSPDPLPRTRLGKLRRHKLRERFTELARGDLQAALAPGPLPEEQMAGEDQQLLQIGVVRRVWNNLAEHFRDRRLTPHSSMHLDLGVDSLGWVDLTLELRERCGVLLAEEALARIETVRDLLREVAEAEEAAATGTTLEEQLRQPELLLNETQLALLEPQRRHERLTGQVLLTMDRALMRAWFRLRVHPEVPDLPDGPLVLVPNHQSALDALALAAALPQSMVPRFYWGGWTGIMFSSAIRRWLSRCTNVLPVDPYGGPATALGLAAAALGRGHSLTWFAEGGRSPDGQLQPFQPGIGLLLRSQAAVAVPVHIHGTYAAMPPRHRWPRRHPVTVTFGTPATVEELEQEGTGDQPQERIARALQQRVAAMAEESGNAS